MQVSRPVRRQHDDRRMDGALRAQLGNRHRRLRQHLEQERLELVVSAVDLVDEQHRRLRAGMAQGAQDRPLDQVLLREHVVVAQPVVPRGFGEPDRQQLARVVPLVERLAGVDALVALEPNERRVERRASDLAASVLPTPASPSSRIGCGSRAAQNSAVDKPASGKYPTLRSRRAVASTSGSSSSTVVTTTRTRSGRRRTRAGNHSRRTTHACRRGRGGARSRPSPRSFRTRGRSPCRSPVPPRSPAGPTVVVVATRSRS